VKVLVVEDDDAIADPLCGGLTREGFEVARVASGGAALSTIDDSVAVVLLDLNLPDLDGLEVCAQLRRRHDVAVICVTARSAEAERVKGLACADDYLVKPFGLGELVARIRVVTRRRAPTVWTAPPRTTFGDVVIDRRTHQVTVAGDPVGLTPKEFDILAALADDPGAVVERHDLLERVWGGPWYGPTKTLDVHVASLRKKLGRPELIEAVRGVGFRLHADR
jgi:DNA-binding response OmpR family regulator